MERFDYQSLLGENLGILEKLLQEVLKSSPETDPSDSSIGDTATRTFEQGSQDWERRWLTLELIKETRLTLNNLRLASKEAQRTLDELP